MKAAFLGLALLLAPGLALRVGLSRRAALHSAATATAGLCVAPAHAEDVSAARAKILAAKKESEERLERLREQVRVFAELDSERTRGSTMSSAQTKDHNK